MNGKWQENALNIRGKRREKKKTLHETRVFSGPGSQPRCWAHREGGRCRLSGRVLDSLGDSEPLSTLACSEMLLTLCRKKKSTFPKANQRPSFCQRVSVWLAECLISTYRLHWEESTGPRTGKGGCWAEMVAMGATWCSPGAGGRLAFHLFAGQGCRP